MSLLNKNNIFKTNNSSCSTGTGSGGYSTTSGTARKLSDGKVNYTPQDLKNNFYNANNKIQLNKETIDFIKDMSERNSNNISNNEMEINILNNKIEKYDDNFNKINKNNGKLLLNVNDKDLDYLENKIDNITLKVIDNKLVASGFEGLEVSIDELNNIKGLNENIMKLISSAIGNMEFLGVSKHYSDIEKITPNNGSMVIVKEDETKDNQEVMYIYNGKSWISYGDVDFKIRNFIENPIDLSREVKGILDDKHISQNIARKQEIESKMDKISLSQANNIIVSNNSGNLECSGKTLNEFANKIHTHPDILEKISVKADRSEIYNPLNKSVLDKFSESKDGNLLFNGKSIKGTSSGEVDLSNIYTRDEINQILGNEELLTKSQEIKGAINELFTKSYRGKELVANSIGNMELATMSYVEISNKILEYKKEIVQALEDKGITTNKNICLNKYAQNINNIIQDSKLKNTKLNMKKGEVKEIELAYPSTIEQCCTSILEYKPSKTNFVCYNCDFDNGDVKNFNYDDSIIFENGTMEQKNKVITTNMNYQYSDEKFDYFSTILDIDEFYSISDIAIIYNDKDVEICELSGTYLPTIVTGNGDINLLGVEKIKKIEWQGNIEGANKMKFIFSINSGTTWQSLNEETEKLINIDIKDSNSLSKAINITKLNNLNEDQLNLIFQNSSKLRFGYYFHKYDANSKLNNDKITIYVDMKGKSIPSQNVEWNLSEDGKFLTYNILKNGTYTIIWIDNRK